MMELKPCPFCGSEGELKRIEQVPTTDGYFGVDVYLVQCNSCYSKSKSFTVRYFAEFSKYSIEDFRKSQLLRAKEEEKYDLYEQEIKSKAIEFWNHRI